ncbi:MAG: hypothetical protein A2Z03_10045 [Chloroflexi bacterium RBG_16_56_8]|nr:MAG: hypothetical protein A2Z03_10045 [Chloroflexi bacterium RBG_16_56_8]
MPMKKFDGVIEAVRYKNGQIVYVRAYERRGVTFSDSLLLDRKTLLERLGKGQRFVTGQRQKYLASTFNIGKPVKVVNVDGRQILTTHDDLMHDDLEAPVF